MPLTDRDRAILAFERSTQGAREGRKGDAIFKTWGCTPTRYFQLLETILDKPEAAAFDPELVNRLLRLREARKAARSPARART